MTSRLVATFAMLLLFARTGSAHRLDEYLQATILSIDQGQVRASMRLIPGVSVSADVIAEIDRNGDGSFSEVEQRGYAARVLGDLTVTLDGKRVTPQLLSLEFPQARQMREGLGEIHLVFLADLPAGGSRHRLMLENRHVRQRSVYLVNATVPTDTALNIVAQTRNEQQSVYELEYELGAGSSPIGGLGRLRGNLGVSGFATLFWLGMSHIAEGTDHLLFLLTLLLPAPLVAVGSCWAGSASVRVSLVRVLKIVTAFTVGHSMTLAMAALGAMHVPSRPVEVLIAVSILVSAIHALRAIFPGREALVAGFFGLVHGLAFASTLGDLGLGFRERVFGILAFNLGVETMQMIVVAMVLPSLLLLSRMRVYAFVRVGGALCAGFAAFAWIMERMFGVSTRVDFALNGIAHHSFGLAGALLMLSVVCVLIVDRTRGWRESLR